MSTSCFLIYFHEKGQCRFVAKDLENKNIVDVIYVVSMWCWCRQNGFPAEGSGLATSCRATSGLLHRSLLKECCLHNERWNEHSQLIYSLAEQRWLEAWEEWEKEAFDVPHADGKNGLFSTRPAWRTARRLRVERIGSFPSAVMPSWVETEDLVHRDSLPDGSADIDGNCLWEDDWPSASFHVTDPPCCTNEH